MRIADTLRERLLAPALDRLAVVRSRHRRSTLAVFGLLSLTVLTAVSLPLPYLEELQASNLEMLLRFRQVIRPTVPLANPVLVRIDAAAERAVGAPWPFPPAVLARAVERLEAEGAGTVVLKGIYQHRGVREVSRDDPLGKAIIAARNVVLPTRPGRGAAPQGEVRRALAGEGPEQLEVLDGMFQRVRMWVPSDRERPAPCWGLAALIHHLKVGQGDVVVDRHLARLGELSIPARDGWLRVDPGLQQAIGQLSLAEVLSGTVEPGRLRGRLVIVGVTGPAELALPVLPNLMLSDPEVHALALATAMTRSGFRRPLWIVTFLLVVLTFLYTAQICYSPVARRPLMVTKIGLILILIPLGALLWFNVELDVARPILVFLMALPLTMAFRWTEIRSGEDRTLESPRQAVVRPGSDTARPAASPGDRLPAGGSPRSIGRVPTGSDGSSSAATPPEGPDLGGAGAPPQVPEVARDASSDVLTDLIRTYLGDRFERPELIGTGGMGMVFRAFSRGLSADVALKVMHPQQARRRGAVERFFREYDVGQRLSHPGFVRVFERGQAGLHYFSMELLAGRSLREELREAYALAWAQVLPILRDVAGALGYAHGIGIFHRDLKPENVMRLTTGGLKILDLGVARVEDAVALTGTGEVVGTLRYMAPEQIEGALPDPRVDIFPLGVIAYELLTGQMPYGPTNLSRKVDRLPVPLSSLDPQPPAGLEALLAECMHPDPDRRPATCRELLERLQMLESAAARE
ncbi:MAG: protein kinase [Candidatus Riflebacteria bacterium]|nr:protein kinase [Candidatus Riflebacteria bacterium]